MEYKDQATTDPTKIVKDVQDNIKELKVDVIQKNNKIVEFDHDINKKEYDITNCKREVDDLKSHVTYLKIDSQLEEIIGRNTQDIQGKNFEICNDQWEFMNIMTTEMDIYKSALGEIKQVNTTLGDKPTQARNTINYSNVLTNKQIKDLQLNIMT